LRNILKLMGHWVTITQLHGFIVSQPVVPTEIIL